MQVFIRFLDWFVATLLLLAAGTKIHRLLTSSGASDLSLPRWAQWTQVELVSWANILLECIVATLLIITVTRRIGRALALLLFGGYLILVSLIVLDGRPAHNCGCFGVQLQMSDRAHVTMLLGVILILTSAVLSENRTSVSTRPSN